MIRPINSTTIRRGVMTSRTWGTPRVPSSALRTPRAPGGNVYSVPPAGCRLLRDLAALDDPTTDGPPDFAIRVRIFVVDEGHVGISIAGMLKHRQKLHAGNPLGVHAHGLTVSAQGTAHGCPGRSRRKSMQPPIVRHGRWGAAILATQLLHGGWVL